MDNTQTPAVKEKPVCRNCGSDDVCVDAVARWDTEAQDWKLSGTHDSGHCNACEEDSKRFNWIPITEEKN